MRQSKRRASWKETSLASGFGTIAALGNGNVYGVFVSLALLNIFKDGMWMKILPPYTLFLCHYEDDILRDLSLDPREVVGATLGVYGVTRAVVSIIAGLLINRLGADTTFAMTGWLGIIGVATNCCCLWLGSIKAIFFLMFVWGGFDGLWGSCLEVVWARSILAEKREDVTWARQVVNQSTRALGPLISLLIFLRTGNQWRISDMRHVMLCGTILSIFPVFTCFRFQRKYEIRQEVNLCDVNRLLFESADIEIKTLQKADCVEDEAGIVKISNFADSKMGKLSIMNADLLDSGYILGQQFRARFKVLESSHDVVCTVHFEDPSRDPVRVALESISLILRRDQSVNIERSSIDFKLYPELTQKKKLSQGQLLAEVATKMWNTASPRGLHGHRLKQRLLPVSSGSLAQPNLTVTPNVSGSFSFAPNVSQDRQAAANIQETAADASFDLRSNTHLETESEKLKREKSSERYTPNLSAANIILLCELLHALAAGFSLRFIDLFLIQDYNLSPASVLFIAFLECCCGAFLASPTQQLMTQMRRSGYHAKTGALSLWGLSLFFLGILCVPGMSMVAVALAVIFMQALNSAPKAYLRAKLLNYLPADRVANYMVWDSLNKATQGGITVVGASVIRNGQYQTCFLCSFGLMLARFVIYGAYTARRLKKGVQDHRVSEPSEGADLVGMHPKLQISTMESHDRGVSVTLSTPTDGYVDIAESVDPESEDLEEIPTSTLMVADEAVTKRTKPASTMATLRESESERSRSKESCAD